MTNTMRDWQRRDLAHIWHPCSQMQDYEDFPPIVVERGEGVYLYDVEGGRYLDIVSSWWCNLLGHGHPAIREAIHTQLDRLEHVIFANFSHPPIIELTERLVASLPPGLVRFNYSDSGSGAVEAALKMAFQYQHQTGHPEKQRFMCLSDGYHGETIGALSVGTMDLYARIYRPMLMDTIRIPAPDCYRCPYGQRREDCAIPCIEAAERLFAAHAHETAALIVEPLLQGSAGMRIYPPRYLAALHALCQRYETLLIADEIATGFGRTGTMFACEQAGISPDMICLSKGLTGGFLPMSVTVTTEAIYQAFYADYREGRAFMHSHTYSGNPLAAAAALAVQDVLRSEPILERAATRADYLTQRLEAALGEHPRVGEIRHIGLIHAIELVADRETRTPLEAEARTGYRIYREALGRGLLLRPLGDVLYFNPPLVIDEAQLDEAVDTTVAAMAAVLGD